VRCCVCAAYQTMAASMAGVEKDGLDAYFKNARTYDQDRVLKAERSRRTAWVVAAVSMGGTGLALVGLAGLTPLKTVVPYVIRVDNSTGITEVLSGLTETRETYSEVVTKANAARYVMAREGFVTSEVRNNFLTVTLMSDQAEQGRFAAWYGAKNPESPQVLLGRSATARVEVKSISMISKEVVQVRFLKTVTRGDEVKKTHWVSTLTYSYSNAQMSATDRLTNPLGFIVSVYRSDPEGQQG
jgi:type IV secretion system protein VirB8